MFPAHSSAKKERLGMRLLLYTLFTIKVTVHCLFINIIIHEQILLLVSSGVLIFMNYALNMKVYCIPASQITSPCFPISSQ